MLETPETNVNMAALRLLRYKMLKATKESEDSKYNTTPMIYVEELNDILVVAGLPVVVPDEVEVRELEVTKS